MTELSKACLRKWWTIPLPLFLFTLVFFGDLLLFPSNQVLSKAGNDLSTYFIYLRDFGFSQLAEGNLALWNPHVYSGIPFAGGFQSALFYPPNWIYLILPLQKALNLDLTLHVFLAGLFMALWARYRGLSGFSSFVCRVLFRFCGGFFPHVYAGHLAPTAAMTWSPLIFLSIDMIIRKPGVAAWSLGVFTLSMQVLAGYPQMVFFTGVVSAIYVGYHLATGRVSLKSFGLMVAMCVGAIFLCAIQLLNAWELGQESVRSTGLSIENASVFSFPPESLLTLLTPGFFGLDQAQPYWGRWYFWEMCLFFGSTGLALAITGVACSVRQTRLLLLSCLGACLILALGANTPVFEFLHSHVPGFDMFRGQSKYIVCASLFLIMFSGIGLDALFKGEIKRPAIFAGLFLGIGLCCAFFGLIIQHSAGAGESGGWWAFSQWVHSSGQSYLPTSTMAEPGFMLASGSHTAKSLFFSAGFLGLAAMLVLLSSQSRGMVYLLGILAMVEILVFGMGIRNTFDIRETRIPALSDMAQTLEGDWRVHNTDIPNSSQAHKMQDIWGYDPLIIARYAEFIRYSQGKDPNGATYATFIERHNKLLELLRCRYFIERNGTNFQVTDTGTALPRALVIKDFQLLKNRDKIFSTLSSPDFDPRQTVILEDTPHIIPNKNAQGVVSVQDMDTDRMIIKADVDAPSIIFITDIYSKGWKARPMAPGPQSSYEVMPANYILRAIPVEKGSHNIMLEYRPTAFVVGKWISIVSLLLFVLILGRDYYLKRRIENAGPEV